MTTRTSRCAPAFVAGLLLAAPLLAHEDDPKLLDREPPYPGPGWRMANPTAGGGSALAAGGFDSQGVLLLSWMTLGEIDGADSGNDCWGYTSPSGREYALMGTSSGTAFIEISDPTDPQIVGYVDGPDSLWRDIKVYQHHAYIVSEGGSGIQVVSLANIDAGNVSLVNTVTTGGSTATHNVAIDEVSGFLYRAGGSSNGLRIYSLANPANPAFVTSWSTRYVHDVQVVTYTSGPYAGKQVAFACSGFNGGWDQTGIEAIDVTNKASIQVLDRVVYPGGAYSHQGWLSEDRQYFFLGDELDENGTIPTRTIVFDVSDLSNIQHLGHFTNGKQATTHNFYTRGPLLFQANYRSGMRVWDTSQSATNPPEIAYFDTYPGSDANGFNGLWSVYPYFPSGVVIGSDLERGLFVWYVGDPTVQIAVPGGVPGFVAPEGESLAVDISGDVVPGSERLYVDSGSGFASLPLQHTGGTSYLANFPAFDCGTSLRWYLSAGSTQGLTWTEPAGAPGAVFSSVAANGGTTTTYDMETTAGWSAGAPGDTATTGIWTRVNPNGTAAQPEDDHTPNGTQCWVTGQGSPGGAIGEADVDNGHTTLLSPIFDMSSADSPVVSYWRWYSNDEGSAPGADVFVVDISFNGGGSWTNVETVGPTGPEASGGWFQHAFSVTDFGTPTNQVRLRFVAADEGAGSIVEAAVDDFEWVDLDCSDCQVDSYCSSLPNSTGLAATIGSFGSLVVADNTFGLFADRCPSNQFGVFFYGPNQLANPFGNGILCVGGQLHRLGLVTTDFFGQVFLQLDLSSPPSAAGEITPGSVWNFQFWYRDPAGGGAAFNTSDAIEVTFCP